MFCRSERGYATKIVLDKWANIQSVDPPPTNPCTSTKRGFGYLTLFQTSLFTCLLYKCFENTVGKGEIARDEQFLFFPQCFLPFWRTFCHFHQIQNCRLQTLSVWKSLKFLVWGRVNPKWFTLNAIRYLYSYCIYWKACINFAWYLSFPLFV